MYNNNYGISRLVSYSLRAISRMRKRDCRNQQKFGKRMILETELRRFAVNERFMHTVHDQK